MRALVLALAIAATVAFAAYELFTMRGTAWTRTFSWAAPLAVLLCGGGVVAIAVLLRNAAARTPRSRRALPSDPGFPREPLSDPYRNLRR